MNKGQTNKLLGFPDDARLLIINADDFGMCNAVNEAIIPVLKAGVVRSTTLMTPCSWAFHAIHFLKAHPEVPFGVHLTVISDPEFYRWGPISSSKKVPFLVDETGYFYRFDRMPELLVHIKLNELEAEFRAQIETVLAAGLSPTHLDWHALRIGSRVDLMDLMLMLAREYGLALRVIGRAFIEKVHNLGLPANDFDFLDSYLIFPEDKPARYAQLLHDLPAGLNEWAVHPGLDTPELLAIEPEGNHVRQADFDFFTSQKVKEIIDAEGIILLDYRSLQRVWIDI